MPPVSLPTTVYLPFVLGVKHWMYNSVYECAYGICVCQLMPLSSLNHCANTHRSCNIALQFEVEREARDNE